MWHPRHIFAILLGGDGVGMGVGGRQALRTRLFLTTNTHPTTACREVQVTYVHRTQSLGAALALIVRSRIIFRPDLGLISPKPLTNNIARATTAPDVASRN